MTAFHTLREGSPIETQTQGHLLRVANVQELRIEKEKGCNQFTNGNVRVLSRRRGQRLHGTFTRTKNERQACCPAPTDKSVVGGRRRGRRSLRPPLT